MRQLTSLDAQFLAVESARTYGHVGGLAIYDPTTAPGGDLTVEDVCRLVGERLPAYAPIWEARERQRAAMPAGRGNPEATGPAILDLVDAADPPLRVFFGIGPLDIIRTEYAARIATWERWDALSREAHGAAN